MTSAPVLQHPTACVFRCKITTSLFISGICSGSSRNDFFFFETVRSEFCLNRPGGILNSFYSSDLEGDPYSL
jgi:hypothetical protein